jgi:2-polyprenyl-6-methoxyphenol hydroxylase-like FAD-dependent oxidoreductase
MRRLQQVPGVTVRQAARVTRLVRDGERVIGVAWQEPDGASQATARVVVGADGVRSFVARAVGPVVEHEEPVRRAMYYAYFEGVPQSDGPAAEFHYRGNHLVYCFPCDGGLTLLAASVPIEMFGEFKRDPAGRLDQELRAMTGLADRLAGAERVGPVLGTGTIPGYLRVPYGPGWALVGDAAMVMDPWSGQGIDQASTHATILAERLREFFEGRAAWGTAMNAYHQQRNDFSRKTYLRTCEFGRDLRPMTLEALQRRGLA